VFLVALSLGLTWGDMPPNIRIPSVVGIVA
jgi:hypothetical protein